MILFLNYMFSSPIKFIMCLFLIMIIFLTAIISIAIIMAGIADIMESKYKYRTCKNRKELIDLVCELGCLDDIGEFSDGYHTFNDLYYQRLILFATLVNTNKDKAWKSKRHENGDKCFDSDNWFIVGITTELGDYTYHYEMKYWDLFHCEELERAKHWDGHTSLNVDRLLSLEGIWQTTTYQNHN